MDAGRGPHVLVASLPPPAGGEAIFGVERFHRRVQTCRQSYNLAADNAKSARSFRTAAQLVTTIRHLNRFWTQHHDRPPGSEFTSRFVIVSATTTSRALQSGLAPGRRQMLKAGFTYQSVGRDRSCELIIRRPNANARQKPGISVASRPSGDSELTCPKARSRHRPRASAWPIARPR